MVSSYQAPGIKQYFAMFWWEWTTPRRASCLSPLWSSSYLSRQKWPRFRSAHVVVLKWFQLAHRFRVDRQPDGERPSRPVVVPLWRSRGDCVVRPHLGVHPRQSEPRRGTPHDQEPAVTGVGMVRTVGVHAAVGDVLGEPFLTAGEAVVFLTDWCQLGGAVPHVGARPPHLARDSVLGEPCVVARLLVVPLLLSQPARGKPLGATGPGKQFGDGASDSTVPSARRRIFKRVVVADVGR